MARDCLTLRTFQRAPKVRSVGRKSRLCFANAAVALVLEENFGHELLICFPQSLAAMDNLRLGVDICLGHIKHILG